MDLTYKLDQFKQSTTHGLVSPYDIKLLGSLLDNPGQSETDGIRTYKRWWCTNDKNVEKYAQNFSNKYCTDQGGTWDGKWCRSTSDEPVFYVNIGDLKPFADNGRLPYCTSGRTFAIVAATSEYAKDQSVWLQKANAIGFKTQQEIDANKAKVTRQAVNKELQIKYEKASAAQSIVASGVGTQICGTSNNITRVGYVERIENSKIKITISDARLANTEIRPGGFTQSVIWDNPENWHPCEYNK
ncbi:MAG: hypothetical protein Q8K02_16140 [Flavobacterium sp.]|nr:hypothetical protein [Flavobacterium sp.]